MGEKIDFEALGRRAVACKGWRWVPGMRILDGAPTGTYLVSADSDGRPLCWAWRYGFEPEEHEGADALPDLRDPATLGCLLALVRKDWRRHVFVEPPSKMNNRFRAFIMSDGAWQVIGKGGSEAEALVVALELAA